MSIENNITFDEFKTKPRFEDNIKTSKMVNMLIKKGIVKNEKQANAVLIICAVTFFIISGYMIKNTLFPSIQEVKISPEEQLLINQTEGKIEENIKKYE